MRLLLAAILVAISPLAHAAEFTIATFNAEFLTRPTVHVKFGFPLELRNPGDIAMWSAPGFRDTKFAEGAAAVAKVAAAINADVIVMTEVGNEADAAELNTAVAAQGVIYPHTAVCTCTDTATRQHVAVLSKLPFTEVVRAVPGREGYFKEEDDDDSVADTGISKGIIVTLTVAGHPVRLFGLHLVSESGGGEADAQRIAQASIIRRETLPAIMAGDALFIVAGDLNDGRGQPALRRISGFDDIWPDLIETGDFEYFRDDPESRWTYLFQGQRNQIDHILLSPSFEQVLTEDGIRPRVPDQTDPLASDHRPFVLTLEFE